MKSRDDWKKELEAQIEKIRADFAAKKQAGAGIDELKPMVEQKKKLSDQVAAIEKGGEAAYKVIEQLQQQESNARLAKIKEKTDEARNAPRQEAREQKAAEAQARAAEREQKQAARQELRDSAAKERAAEREQKQAARQDQRTAAAGARKEAREQNQADRTQAKEAELARRQKEAASYQKNSPGVKTPAPAPSVDERVKAAAERSQKIADKAAGLAAAAPERKPLFKK